MKIAFWGTGDFSVSILEELYKQDDIEIVAIISRPDKPIGRKKILTPTAVSVFANNNKIALYQPAKLRKLDPTHDIFLLDVDFFVVASFGAIMPKSILDIPKFGPINVHTSLLPKYRGASPIQTAIKNGESISGVTVMFMNEKMDEGDIILQKEVPLHRDIHSYEVFDIFAQISPSVLLEGLRGIYGNILSGKEQDHSQATLAPMIDKTDAKISFQNMTALQIYDFFRAFSTWPKIYCEFEGKKVIFEDIQYTGENNENEISKLYKIEKEYFINGMQGKQIQVKQIKIEGKKSMDIASAVNGNPQLLTTILL